MVVYNAISFHLVQYPIAKLVLRYMTSRNITQTFNQFLAHISIYV